MLRRFRHQGGDYYIDFVFVGTTPREVVSWVTRNAPELKTSIARACGYAVDWGCSVTIGPNGYCEPVRSEITPEGMNKSQMSRLNVRRGRKG